MRTTLIALSLGIAALGGCATTQQQELAAYGGYGNHLAIGELEQERLAIEAVRQLASIYAPAQTRLELKQPTPDAFGLTLVKELRDRGYAVLEYAPKPPTENGEPANKPTPSDFQALRYVLDKAGADFYRLTIAVGGESITRPYVDQEGVCVPAGYWAHKVSNRR